MLRTPIAAAAVALGFAVTTAACGGAVREVPGDIDPNSVAVDAGRHDAGRRLAGDAGGSNEPPPSSERGPIEVDGGVPGEFHEGQCPDAAAPPPKVECDIYAPPRGGCPQGQGCFPYVIYPSGPCEHEQYGALCAAAGTSKQGDACQGGAGECAAGLVCVITGSGDQCAQVCDISKASPCPAGLVCEPIDVSAYGVCQ